MGSPGAGHVEGSPGRDTVEGARWMGPVEGVPCREFPGGGGLGMNWSFMIYTWAGNGV